VIVIDSLLVGGLRFVLDKIARAVDHEMNDAGRVREELLEVQMRYELGEITREELDALESALLTRLREIRAREERGGA
jgi:hypothetical protein